MNVTSEKQIRELKNRVTEKAVELFAQKSVDQVTVNEICQASGITKPTFYKYLSSKESLLLHYYRHALDEMEHAWQECSGSGDFLEQILLMVRATVQTEEKNGPDLLAKYLIYSFKHSKTIGWDDTPSWKRMIDAIEQAQKAHQIANPGEPEMIARGLQNIILSLRTSWAASQGGFSLREACKRESIAFLQPVQAVSQEPIQIQSADGQ